MKKKYYYDNDDFKLILGDSLKKLKNIESKSIDMIFADPPYFLSGDGISCSGGKMVSVNKGDWDKKISIDEKHKFNRKWIKQCYQVLKDDGTIWISGTMHNIYSIGMALEQEGFKIINNITWKKLNPPPNISCRFFVHSTETILWAKKDLKTVKTSRVPEPSDSPVKVSSHARLSTLSSTLRENSLTQDGLYNISPIRGVHA